MNDRSDSPPPGLLARKGEARPAMRPVNDNGPLPAAAIGPASAAISGAAAAMLSAAVALADGRRAAITLRLEPERHMRLRLACALGSRSAQAILGEALDAHLKTIPGIDRLFAEAMAASGDQAATGWGNE